MGFILLWQKKPSTPSCPDEEIARQLGLPPNAPVIKIEMTAYLSDGRAFEYTISYKNPKKYCLEIRSYRLKQPSALFTRKLTVFFSWMKRPQVEIFSGAVVM